MKKFILSCLISLIIITIGFYCFRLWNKGRETATLSCLLSICRIFEDGEIKSLDPKYFDITWKILEGLERTTLIAELVSNSKFDCSKVIRNSFQDLWGEPIIFAVRKQSKSSDILLLQVSSLGPDHIKDSSDDILALGKLKMNKKRKEKGD